MKLRMKRWMAAAALALCIGPAAAGEWISIKQAQGAAIKAFVAGPEDAGEAVLVVHDWFGITDATRAAVDMLGAGGYRALAVDLYDGQSASTHDEATRLMNQFYLADKPRVDRLLDGGLHHLRRSGRALATLGFSMGGLPSFLVHLRSPDAVAASVIVYGSGFDKMASAQLANLKNPLLAISGALDDGSVQSSLAFVPLARRARQSFEMHIYPDADHAYMQPLFNQGRNYKAELADSTWKLVFDFLKRQLRVRKEAASR